MKKKSTLCYWSVCTLIVFLLPLISFSVWDLMNHLTEHAVRIFVRWIPYFACAFLLLIYTLSITNNLVIRGFLALFILCVNLLNALYLISIHIQETGFNAAFWASLKWSMIAGSSVLTQISIAAYLLLTILMVLVCFTFPKVPTTTSIFWKKALLISSISILLIGYCFFSKPARILAQDIIQTRSLVKKANLIWKKYPILKKHYDHYTNPTPPKHKYNVIWIMVESYDRGFIDTNIAKNLKHLSQKSYFFKEIYQLPQLNNTAFGHFAYFCGIWIHADPILPKTPNGWVSHQCIPRILQKNNYHTIDLDGISSEYMNTNHRLQTIGFQEVIGYEHLKQDQRYKNMATNRNWGGLFDQDLYTVAWNKLLSIKKKPFFLNISTIDNHEPFLDLSPVCQKTLPQAHNLSQIIKRSGICTDQLLGQFIKKIRASSFSKNTIIIISNDHLSPWKDAYIQALHIKQKDRRLMLIINYPDNRTKIIEHPGTHLDVGPTVLEAIGFSGNTNLGLGWSLLSHNKGFLDTYLPSKERNIVLYGTHMMWK